MGPILMHKEATIADIFRVLGYSSAVQAALAKGHDEVVGLLLINGAM
jgi:hypothetical protein